MSKISDKKREKIKEEILRVLYENSPRGLSTSFVAEEIIRDNEFVLVLLKEMQKMGFVVGLKSKYSKKKVRFKWRLSDKVFKGY